MAVLSVLKEHTRSHTDRKSRNILSERTRNWNISQCGPVSFIKNEALLMCFLRVFRHLVENQTLKGPHLTQLKDNLPRLAAAQLFIAKTYFLPASPIFWDFSTTGMMLRPGTLARHWSLGGLDLSTHPQCSVCSKHQPWNSIRGTELRAGGSRSQDPA